MLFRCRHLLPIAFAAMLMANGAPAYAEGGCLAPRALVQLGEPLSVAQRNLAVNSAVRVVALGSSSTQGTGASNPRMCYPAQLELELNRHAADGQRFEVVNLGVGGQLATDMVARIDHDVLALRPQVVIWQTGVNDAVVGVPLEDFRMALAQGIDALLAGGTDVILLDAQYYPRASKVPGFADYNATMRAVAREKGVPIVSRFAIMKYLVDSAQYTTAQLLAPDQFHLSDIAYHCLGSLLADAIGDGISRAAATRIGAVDHRRAPR